MLYSTRLYDFIKYITSFGGYKKENKLILKEVGEQDKVVDIGSGPGSITKHIAKISKLTVALDKSKGALKKARKNEKVNVVRADAHKIPFKSNTFDVAVSSASMHHFKDVEQVISEICRISKKVVILDTKKPKSILNKFFLKFFDLGSSFKTLGEFEVYLKKKGFIITKCLKKRVGIFSRLFIVGEKHAF